MQQELAKIITDNQWQQQLLKSQPFQIKKFLTLSKHEKFVPKLTKCLIGHVRTLKEN